LQGAVHDHPPSISDLLEGVTLTLERVVLPDPAASADVLTDLLGVIDRVAGVLPEHVRHLTDDNADMRSSLGRVKELAGVDLGVDISPAGSSLAIADLEDENCALKAAVVDVIARLDLPAGPDASAAQRDADREVLELLLRILHREVAAAPPVPSRINPTAGAGSASDPPDLVEAALRRFLASEMPDATALEIADVRRMSGGASREAWTFDVSWTAGGESHVERCVMLRHPVSSVLESDDSAEKITGSRRLTGTDFNVIRLMESEGIPVPHMLWVDPDGTWLERPFSIGRWLPGTADVAPLVGTARGEAIVEQYIHVLARLHAIDPAAAGIDFLGDPSRETAALEQIELFELGYHKQRLEHFPAIEYMISWLKKHQPVASRVSIIHGDFRLGNFMWDNDGILAMLDWEQCHLGDPLEEIAFMYWHLWTLQPFIPIEEFIARYEQAGGVAVDRDALAFYRVFIELKMAVVLLTGVKSYFATEDRQLMYGSSMAFEMLRETQLRVIDELLTGGPTVAFDATARRD
jgi:aminoglycoside phosphotransferase (APT) family kinase protein